MRKAILIIMCSLCTVVYAQEQVFTYLNNEVVNKTKFVSSFENGRFDNITSHTLQNSYKVLSRSDEQYIVKCYKNKGWENEPGDYHYFEILHNGKVIFDLDYADGWRYLSDKLSSLPLTTEAFFYTHLTDDAVALCFTGITIMSQPPFLTVVIVKNGKATLVFNQPSYIIKNAYTHNELSLSLQANTVEYRDVGVPCNSPELHTLEFKDGMIYYK